MWQQKDFETALRYSYATMLHFLSALSALLEAYSSSPHSVEINCISCLLDFTWIWFWWIMNNNIFAKQKAGCDTIHLYRSRRYVKFKLQKNFYEFTLWSFSPSHFFEFAMSFNVGNKKSFQKCLWWKQRPFLLCRKNKIYHQVLLGVCHRKNVEN